MRQRAHGLRGAARLAGRGGWATPDVGGVLLVGGTAARRRTGFYLVNFTRCRHLLAPVLHRHVVHMLGNSRIRLSRAARMHQRRLHRALLVLVGPALEEGAFGNVAGG